MNKLSQEKFNELSEELAYRKSELRNEITNEIKYATEQGDFYRENFPFQAAMEKHDLNERRILEIDEILKKAKITKVLKSKNIGIGSKIIFLKDNKRLEVTIVDTIEINPAEKKISKDSPIGKILFGKSEGDKFKSEGSEIEIVEVK